MWATAHVHVCVHNQILALMDMCCYVLPLVFMVIPIASQYPAGKQMFKVNQIENWAPSE